MSSTWWVMCDWTPNLLKAPLGKSSGSKVMIWNCARLLKECHPNYHPFGAFFGPFFFTAPDLFVYKFVFQVATQKSLPSQGRSHISHLKEKTSSSKMPAGMGYGTVPQRIWNVFLGFLFRSVGTTPHVQFLDEKDPWCQSSWWLEPRGSC